MYLNLVYSILPFLTALVWLFIMISIKEKGHRRSLLITLFAYSSVIYLCHAVFFNYWYELYMILDSFWVFSSLMVYPIFYIFIRVMTTEEKLEWNWIWFALPPAILATISGLLYLLMTPAESEAFVRGVLYEQPGFDIDTTLVYLQSIRVTTVKVMFFIQVTGTLIFGLKLIINFNNRIKDYYSNTSGRDMTRMKWILGLFVLFSITSIASNFLDKSFFITHPRLLIFPAILFSFFLTALGCLLYKQKFGVENFILEIEEDELRVTDIFSNKSIRRSNAKQFKVSGMTHLKDQINHLLKKEEIFLLHDLKISDIANFLDTNRTYISKIISEEYNSSFSELINSHRVNYAMTLLVKKGETLTMSEIANQSGFSSESTFFRTFKSKLGVSPGEFRKQLTT